MLIFDVHFETLDILDRTDTLDLEQNFLLESLPHIAEVLSLGGVLRQFLIKLLDLKVVVVIWAFVTLRLIVYHIGRALPGINLRKFHLISQLKIKSVYK